MNDTISTLLKRIATIALEKSIENTKQKLARENTELKEEINRLKRKRNSIEVEYKIIK